MILDMNPGGVVKVGVIWMARGEILENVMGALNALLIFRGCGDSQEVDRVAASNFHLKLVDSMRS
jgi:hypothetical protein